MKKYKVTLTAEERQQLHDLIAAGKAAAQKLAHARILLKADAADGGPAWPDDRIAEALEVSSATVGRVRQRFVEQGLEAALVRKQQERPSRERKLDGRAEARLIALACSAAAGGRTAWTLQLLADKLVELEVVETVSRRDGAARAQKNELKPRLKEQWCIPPEANAEFVGAMEDVLEVYHRPYDPEAAGGLPGRGQQAVDRRDVGRRCPPGPGQPARFDYEYVRNGTANLFMVFEPLLGWRAVDGDGATDGHGLRRGDALAGRGGARRGGEGRAGDGQPEHAQAGVACTRRSSRSRRGGSRSGWRSTTRPSTAVG